MTPDTLEALRVLTPPPAVKFSQWAERHFYIAAGANLGRFRCWPYQREPLDAMGDPSIPRVTWMKSARIGYSKCLVIALCATTVLSPCSQILLVPTDDDAKGYSVDEIEPAFEASPTLRDLLPTRGDEGRNTLTIKHFIGGGDLKILAAKAPRNLRRHDARNLYIDEEDGMVVTAEGDPVALAEKRTLAHADRKIIRGSTPTDEMRSTISRAYDESDQRIFEVPCPHCLTFFELLWPHIRWPKDEPEKAYAECPHCHDPIDESHKRWMVNSGGERGWHRQRPDVIGHAGFRSNTFVSFFANARWPILAAEFVKARRSGLSELQVFANTVEGRVWKTSLDSVDEHTLRSRCEDFGLATGEDGRNRFPAECFLVIATVDTQDDRFEVGYFGFNESELFFLGHEIVWGDPGDKETQAELDRKLFDARWQHPKGWELRVEASCIDSRGHKTQAVYDYCATRLAKKCFPIIAQAGVRPLWSNQGPRREANKPRHFVVGHDEAKTLALQRLAIPMVDAEGAPSLHRIRYSTDLPEETFEQLTSERRVRKVQASTGRIEIKFIPRKAGMRNEALDLLCYAIALRHIMRVNFIERRSRGAGHNARPAPKGRKTVRSNYMNR